MIRQVWTIAGVAALWLGLAGCQVAPTQNASSTLSAVSLVSPRPPSIPGVDAPELAKLGPYAVGTTLDSFKLPVRATLTTDGVASGRLETVARTLTVRVWYPAEAVTGARPVSYPHILQRPGIQDIELRTPGIAFADAAPATHAKFPLVVVSHGYGGWSESMSYLTENLASKGYIVIAIDHQDRRRNPKISAQLDFGNVLMDRSRDQREVIAALIRRSATDTAGYASMIDAGKIGLIGYSMGGYGALATAGAPYYAGASTLNLLPAEGRVALLEDGGPNVSGEIKALVAFAPWGAQPASRMWTADSLKGIHAPVLMIDGDQDDVVHYQDGSRWAFDHMTSDRYFLVFENARHNVGNNPAPLDFGGPLSVLEFFSEPVWRIDRINAVNLHFVTAFLDLKLKGDVPKAAYLTVPIPKSNDGKWSTSSGAPQSEGATAGAAEPGYWPGFQQRWALGLELHHQSSGR